MRRLSLIGILAVFLTSIPLRFTDAETAMDFAIPNGHFYKQANGQGGAGDNGFAVTDDEGVPFWTWFQRFGGIPGVGYPVSNRFTWQNFIVQAFQRVVFQWRPEKNSVAFVNVFDELSAAGKDDWLLAVRSVPKAADWSSDRDRSWGQVSQNHLALLDQNVAIKQVYLGESDPAAMNGLPMAAQDYGMVYVVRAQRKIFQQWKQDTPWAKAGEVTVANGGDITKESGIWPPAPFTPGPVPKPAVIAPPVSPIRINGDSTCVSQTNLALKLLSDKAAVHYGIVTNNVGVIECADSGSGMFAWEKPPRYQVGKATRDAGTIWYAGTIAHDACHSKLYHDYLTNNPAPTSVPSDIWTGKEAEKQCLDVQYDALKQMGADQSTLDYVQNVINTGYWNIDYGSRWW